MELGLYLDIIIYFGILSRTTWADDNGGNIILTCNTTKKVESPNYPANYDNNANIAWNITALAHNGIAVVFEKITMIRGGDALTIQDPERSFSSRNYSGLQKKIPPFLSTQSSLLISFQSNRRYSANGFSLGLHCYETSERTSNIKLKSSTRANEGILEVLNPNTTNEWLPVCDESWNSTLAEISCSQLGFPGVYNFASEIDEQYNKSTCAKIDCGKSDFLLHHCALKLERQDSMNASRLNCFTFGYLGCFPLPSKPEEFLRSETTEVGDCLHACSAKSFQLAAIRWDGCRCLNNSQSEIYNETPDHEKCTPDCEGTQCQSDINNWAFHYNVTIGFCEHPGDVAHGWWSSKHTYLGSRLTLTCEPGYVINGRKTIDCKQHDADQKIAWDYEIPHCQYLQSTLYPPTVPATPSEPATTRKVDTRAYVIPPVVVIVVVFVLVLVIFRESICRKVCRSQSGSSTSSEDSSLDNATPVKSTTACTQICSELSKREGACQETVKENSQQGESPTSALSQKTPKAAVYAKVDKAGQDHKNSLTTASAEKDKRETRADAFLELLKGSDDRTEMSVKCLHQMSCDKSQTMRNRQLPQCPKDGAIKPPIAPRKAQTLTRKDQAGACDFSMNTSKENLPPPTAPRDRGHVNKKAPGGSTPYVKSRGKRATKNKDDHQVKGVSCSDDSAVSASQRLSGVSSSAYSTIDDFPGKGNMSSRDKTEKLVSSNNNSNIVFWDSNAVPSEQVYFDIDDTNGNGVSTGMTGGAFGLEGRFGDDLKPSSPACPAVQQASNLYHTLEPTNAEYEDIRNTEAKFDGNGTYDLLNFE